MHNSPAKGDAMRHSLLVLLGFLLLGGIRAAVAGTPEALIRAPIDESDRVTLGGNTPPSAGYDLATGLGSVNATNLFDAWPD